MSIDQQLSPSPVLERSTRRVEELRGDVLARASRVTPDGPAPVRRPTRRRVLAVGLVAAAAAGALVVGPSLLPAEDSGRPNPLAAVAAAAEGTDRGPLATGEVVLRVERLRQTASTPNLRIDRRTETWVLPDGRFYERSTDLRPGTDPEDRVFTYASDPMNPLRTPVAVAELPTDPDALVRRVAQVPPGAEVDDAARRRAAEALVGVLSDGYAPSDVYATALTALGSVPGVRVRHDAAAGETTVSHWMQSKRGDETLTFRDRDGALVRLEASTTQDGGAQQVSRFSVRRVDAVPAEVRRAAERQAEEQQR
ncbi:MAG: hypothetical protein PGN07_06090 [Aeromicrobium erythreum]